MGIFDSLFGNKKKQEQEVSQDEMEIIQKELKEYLYDFPYEIEVELKKVF